MLQTIYAMKQSGSENLDTTRKFLEASLENFQDLYLLVMDVFLQIQKKESEFIELSQKKHLATSAEKNPNKKFINNKVLQLFASSTSLQNALETRRINSWHLNEDYISIILKEIKEYVLYQKYMVSNKSNFEEDLDFIKDVFTEIIAPNEKIADFLEDLKITFTDDLPLVNTVILKQFKTINSKTSEFKIPNLFRDEEDKEFGIKLLEKTLLNDATLAAAFEHRTPNWESDRIAEVDTIILKMAIGELLFFPSIPISVTINEYLEIAKEYSTLKSSIFINGVLDAYVKDEANATKIKKSARGLIKK